MSVRPWSDNWGLKSIASGTLLATSMEGGADHLLSDALQSRHTDETIWALALPSLLKHHGPCDDDYYVGIRM